MDAFASPLLVVAGQRGYLEASTDYMGASLDLMHVRDVDSGKPDTATGDYHGTNLRGAFQLSPDTAVLGQIGQRSVSNGTDTYRYNNWQLGGQYRIFEHSGNLPDVAIRLSGWGNLAEVTQTSTATVLPGARLDTARIEKPSDRQLQADLLAAWPTGDASNVSAIVSFGTTQLQYGSLSATTMLDGCSYNLAFNGNAIYGTLAKPCSAGIYLTEIYDNSGRLGIDVASEIAWHGTFFQAGVNSVWRRANWTFQTGYLFQKSIRVAVDDILAARGKPSYSSNHNLQAEAAYRINGTWELLGRFQWSSNLFFNEIPVTYNTSTSQRFGSKYSLFTFGTRWNF
ncbi:MAG: hypothetical protein ACR2I0_03370 [Rhodoferax sp.]